jgi:probable HAF family extracellular repeat protein
MKSIVTLIAASTLLAVLAIAQPAPRYTVTDLGTLPGGTFSQGSQGNTNNGLVGGVSTVPGGALHAAVWYKGQILDLAKTGLGGPNSWTLGVNERGQAAGVAETSTPDSENFCAFFSGFQCLPFVWQNGVMTKLPTLGGPNGGVSVINSQGEMAGVAENGVTDLSCIAPVQHDFQAVKWDSKGEIHELHPFPGDTVGFAFWMNDNGQVVGTSGSCANTQPVGVVVGPHAVLWEKDGSVHELPSLGGTVNTTLFAVGNRAISINNQGQMVGGSTLPGNTTAHAVLWPNKTSILDLGTLPGDFVSGALEINDRGDVVGVSQDPSGNPRAFLWQNGAMHDLNDLIPPNSPLYLLFAAGIDSRGEIAGFGLTSAFEVHAFLATPSNGAAASQSFSPASQAVTSPMILSEEARTLLQLRLRFGGFGARPIAPR